MSGPYGNQRQRRLRAAFEAADLSTEELWLRYFSLGRNAGKVEIDAYINGLMKFTALQHDILAHAINEHLGELSPPRAPYSSPDDMSVSEDGGDSRESSELSDGPHSSDGSCGPN